MTLVGGKLTLKALDPETAMQRASAAFRSITDA